MIKVCSILLLFGPVLQIGTNVDKETLVRVIIILSLILLAVVGYEIHRIFKGSAKGRFKRIFRKVRLEVTLKKDRLFYPQVLTLTIENTGKREADIDAPVIEFRKIWSVRKFRLNGINGNNIYPIFIDAGKIHQLHIETTTFHQYDRSIKSYYWARIYVTDVDGRKWRSNKVKLRRSLVT